MFIKIANDLCINYIIDLFTSNNLTCLVEFCPVTVERYLRNQQVGTRTQIPQHKGEVRGKREQRTCILHYAQVIAKGQWKYCFVGSSLLSPLLKRLLCCSSDSPVLKFIFTIHL